MFWQAPLSAITLGTRLTTTPITTKQETAQHNAESSSRRPRTQVVPDVHFAGERPHIDNRLSQEVVGLRS